MTLTRFQQGGLAALKSLHAALMDLHDKGEQLDIERVFELLAASISFLEAFDEEEGRR